MPSFGADLGFWLGAGLISFAVGLVLLRAMAKGAAADAGAADDGGTAKALALYRDQLAEVDRDVARGTLAPDEADRLRTEVQRRMLDTARRGGTAAPAGNARFGQTLGLGVIVAALAASAAMYLQLGAPAYPDLPLSKRLAMAQQIYEARPTQAQAEAAAPPAPAAPVDDDFMALMTQLRSAVAARPNDVQGLTLLAKNEAALGNFAASASAHTALIAAKGDTAVAADHLGAAQAMIAAAGGMVSPEAEAQLQAALTLDPANPMARYFLGLLFAQTARPDRAFALWQPLIAQGPDGAPWIAAIESLLPEVADAAGIPYTPAKDLAKLAGPDAADMANAADMTDGERAAMINTMVSGLEERLLTTGGSAEEWLRLVNALGVLGETGRLRLARAAGEAALAGDPAALQALRDAAARAGNAP